MDDGDRALHAINDGFADMISLGRPLLADPDSVNKFRAGRTETIRPCLSCQEGCMGRIQSYAALNCAVNPEAGREADHKIRPALRPKKVMIIGGGIAGLESARVLAERGHKPEVFEAGDSLGGVVIAGGMPSFKEDDHDLIRWYENQLAAARRPRAPQHPRHRADDRRHGCGPHHPRHRLDAARSRPGRRHSRDRGDRRAQGPVRAARQARRDRGRRPHRLQAALHLKELDETTQVTIVEAGDDVLALSGPLCHANHDMLHDLVTFKGVSVVTNAFVKATTAEGLVVTVGGAVQSVPADAVVTAVGYRSSEPLADALAKSPVPSHVLGDARKVSNIMFAIWDAFEIATEL